MSTQELSAIWRPIGACLVKRGSESIQPVVDPPSRANPRVLNHRFAPDLVLALLAAPERVTVEHRDKLHQWSALQTIHRITGALWRRSRA